MKTAIVVGSGAGGATIANELQGSYQVTVLEAGSAFQPFRHSLPMLERVRKTGLLFDEHEIQLVFPRMEIRKANDGLILVNGRGLGGTTTIGTGNALRMDADLRALGIDLDAEFADLANDIPITTAHQSGWRPITQHLFAICEELGLNPQATPKMGDYANCVHCGRCVFGCPRGVKWDSRRYLDQAVTKGACLITDRDVEWVVISEGRATGVMAKHGLTRHFYPADLVILAAGGFATPNILQASGIACEPHLFVDPVLCVAAELRDAGQCNELQMPFVVQRDGYIVSPYLDYLSFFFNKAWRHHATDIVSLMIKIADTEDGRVDQDRVTKGLSTQDRARLADGTSLCTEILGRLGIDETQIFLGTLNAGHPGGSLPLTAREATTLHHDQLPANVYVADATLLPKSLGNPPSLTIMAVAKRIASLCKAAA